MSIPTSTALPSRRLRCLLCGLLSLSLSSVAFAQNELLAIEFNEDDQPEFDLWPGAITGNMVSAQISGITVDISTNTSFALPTNRGSMDGTPPGYSYQKLYEDLLHAFTPTGTLTMDFSGLVPNAPYRFVLYAWDPGLGAGTHEWSITVGTSQPSVQTVDWSQPLVDNESFALVFEVTTDSNGTFQVDNTAGLAGSAINGFRLFDNTSVGTSYCGPAVPNTTGQPGVLEASGSNVAAANNLTLMGSGLPLNQFGIFINGTQSGLISNPGGSQGDLCIVGAIGRYNGPGQLQNSGSTGTISLDLDLTMTPTPSGPVSIVVGQTWYFQAWYRDWLPGMGATSNFTDGIEITFQ